MQGFWRLVALLGFVFYGADLSFAVADVNGAEEQKEDGLPAQDTLAQPAMGEGIDDFDQIDLEQLLNVVVSATKTEQTVEQAPAIVTVISEVDIREWGYTSVAEVLKHVAGFHLVDDHITPNVAVRGISGGLRSESGMIKVMIDGHPVAMRQTGGNWLGPELVPMTAIARIEVIRGPASALYGADAFLGVVNIITKMGKDLSGAQVISTGGYSGENLGGGQDFAFGTRVGDLDVLLAGRLAYRDLSGLKLPGSSPDPHVPSFHEDDPVAAGLDQLSGSGLAKLTYHLSEKSRASVSMHASVLDRGAEFADWTQLAAGVDDQGRIGENRISLRQGFFDGNLSLALSESVQLDVDALYFRGEPTGRDRLEVGSDLHYVERQFRYQGGELSLGTTWLALSSLTLVSGLGIIYDEERLPSNLHVLKLDVGTLSAGEVRESTSTRQGIKAFLNPGGFVQAVWSPLEETLSLTGGVRYDHHNIYGSQVSGRAGAVYTPLKSLSLKLLYGNAFKAPSPLLLYGVPLHSGDIIGNPDLKPQRIHTVEMQASYHPLKFLTLRTDLAYSWLLNKAEFTLQGVNKVARNAAEAGCLSWETELEARWERWLRGYLNLSMVYSVRDPGREGYLSELLGAETTTYPMWIMHAGVRGRLPWFPLRFTLETSVVSARDSSDDNSLENGAVYSLDAYVLLNASIALTDLNLFADKKSELRLLGTNLTGVDGPEPGYAGIDYPLAPRAVFLQLWLEL